MYTVNRCTCILYNLYIPIVCHTLLNPLSILKTLVTRSIHSPCITQYHRLLEVRSSFLDVLLRFFLVVFLDVSLYIFLCVFFIYI
ncbi:hypothetical protein VN97_g10514 [Penicillium thymicola]|uniref:Uncharacterized protein n=1 Tax=Penicillium thymicola TaxID=293382 RepID=A0AAI9X489_PENTH|nr:hypothetical protein VN97_g10514 [Penicillium thymicola]